MKIYKFTIFVLTWIVLFAQDNESENYSISYYRDELSFIKDIRLPIKEMNNGEYVKTIRNSNGNVIEILWYSSSDSLLRKRNYKYNTQGDLSLISHLEDGRIKSELWFKDISKSYDYFQFIYGSGFSPMEPNRLTEVFYNIQLLPEKYIFYTQSNKIIGLIAVNYDFENGDVKEVWFLGNRKKEVRILEYKLKNLQ